MTNYERLKSMTIEEMAEFLDDIEIEPGTQADWQRYIGESAIRWLKEDSN